MKIGFALQKKDELLLADGFHGNKWIGLFDIENNTFEQHAITDLEQKFSGTNLLTIFSELDVKIILCNKIHHMSLRFFNENNISVYKSESEQLEYNIETLKQGKLIRFTTQMVERSGCGLSCNTCDSATCN